VSGFVAIWHDLPQKSQAKLVSPNYSPVRSRRNANLPLQQQWPPLLSLASFQGVCLLLVVIDTPQLTLFTEMHISARRHALSKFSMPAMSPTMTEGGIASWKKAEGESFTAGDVLLEIVHFYPSCSIPFFMSVHRRQTRPQLTWKPRTTVSSPRSL
jgi:hypothetical protein